MKRLLDTNTVLYLLGGKLAAPLEPAEYFVSTISEMELLSYPGITPDAEKQIVLFLSDIVVVDLTKEIKDEAIRLRRQHSLRLPDAIIVASAVVVGAELLTNDLRLLKLADVQARSLALKQNGR